jgi:hypothetical protein
MKETFRGWRHHLLPWAGLICAGLGWALTDQIGSNYAFDMCQHANPLLMGLIGLAGIVVALGGGLLSYRVWRRDGETDTRRFLGLVAALAGLLFSVAIIFQTISSFIIPRCFG